LALSEFVAMETAYLALQQLDPAGRQRALHWLTDALSVSGPLPKAPAPATATEAELAAVAEPSRETRPRRRARGSDQPRRGTRAVTSGRGRSTVTPGRGRSAVTSGSAERAYRRMPDADAVLAAYKEVGSVSGLADYFDVPRHTVQGWARRLRREGYDIGRTASA
jgi:hypothetical protein